MIGKILIVEHKEDLLNRITSILRAKGFNVQSLLLKAQLISMVIENNIDVILIDADINQGNGLELVRMLKNNERTATIPIVLLSTPYKKSEYIYEAIDAGIDGLLLIPFEEVDLIVKINSAMKIKKLIVNLDEFEIEKENLKTQIKDISEESLKFSNSLNELNKKYEQSLEIDERMGILNKKGLYSQLERSVHEYVRHGESMILACFSIDYLEKLKNEFGRDIANSIEEQFVETLKTVIRKEDLIATLRENEIVVAFKRMREDILEEKVDEIKRLVSKQEIIDNGIVIKFSITSGIVLIRYKSTYAIQGIENEILAVEIALNNARRRGAGSVFLHPTIVRS